jgi:hypothetical protein
MLSGGLEVPAHVRGVQQRKWRGPRVLVCFGLGVFRVAGRSVWVQQHYGIGSCTGGGPLGVLVSAPLFLFQHWITSEVSIHARVRLWVEAAGVPRLLCHRCE